MYVCMYVECTYVFMCVCVHVKVRGKTTDCHSCALFLVVVIICLFKRGFLTDLSIDQ